MDLTRFKSHGVVKSRNRKEFSCIYTQCTVFFSYMVIVTYISTRVLS